MIFCLLLNTPEGIVNGLSQWRYVFFFQLTVTMNLGMWIYSYPNHFNVIQVRLKEMSCFHWYIVWISFILQEFTSFLSPKSNTNKNQPTHVREITIMAKTVNMLFAVQGLRALCKVYSTAKKNNWVKEIWIKLRTLE